MHAGAYRYTMIAAAVFFSQSGFKSWSVHAQMTVHSLFPRGQTRVELAMPVEAGVNTESDSGGFIYELRKDSLVRCIQSSHIRI